MTTMVDTSQLYVLPNAARGDFGLDTPVSTSRYGKTLLQGTFEGLGSAMHWP